MSDPNTMVTAKGTFHRGTKYLIQDVTGDVHIFDKILAKRKDMHPYDPFAVEQKVQSNLEALAKTIGHDQFMSFLAGIAQNGQGQMAETVKRALELMFPITQATPEEIRSISSEAVFSGNESAPSFAGNESTPSPFVGLAATPPIGFAATPPSTENQSVEPPDWVETKDNKVKIGNNVPDINIHPYTPETSAPGLLSPDALKALNKSQLISYAEKQLNQKLNPNLSKPELLTEIIAFQQSEIVDLRNQG